MIDPHKISPGALLFWSGTIAWAVTGYTAVFYAIVWVVDRFILRGWCS